MPTTSPAGVVRLPSVAQKAYIHSDTPTAGSSAANYWRFEVLKNNTTVIYDRSTTAAELVAFDEYDLGAPASAAAANLAIGDTIQLRTTKVGAPTDLSDARLSLAFHANIDVGV